ncbi:class I SAM-dependent methyltransferase [Ancylobacter sp. MQZ15Z-1]|uniref:Class I SAM-dependent methyltransferase n=1 Tax=Ancylobacter mangrovi TaxID=2972472 RepID=A0A9X2P8Q1_9HYPH|nr:class I SAM-dependent methyltransferase [Ancylobacter mangrovi]MCS0494096.1 class I SAM-dependent methyltransferase [Ancylobacter mangrovi]
MSTSMVDTTYESYANLPEYVSVNQVLIDQIDLQGVRRVADLACGTGLLSGLLLDRKPGLAICGVDLDPEQTGIAARTFAARGRLLPDLDAFRAEGAQGACFLTRSADELPLADGEVDLVMIGNAIHLMPDKDKFLAEVARILRPGGAFIFNSLFYVGTFPEGSEPVYTEWLKQSAIILDEKNRARIAAGEPPIPRKRGGGGRAFAKGWLSPEGWAEKVEAAGMSVTSVGRSESVISRSGLQLIGAYGGLAEVLMSGYPVDIAAACLFEGVDRAFDEMGIESVPRYWMEMKARR